MFQAAFSNVLYPLPMESGLGSHLARLCPARRWPPPRPHAPLRSLTSLDLDVGVRRCDVVFPAASPPAPLRPWCLRPAQEAEGAGGAGAGAEAGGEAAPARAEAERPRAAAQPEEAGEAAGRGAAEAAGEDPAGGAQAAAGPAQPAVHPAHRGAAEPRQGTSSALLRGSHPRWLLQHSLEAGGSGAASADLRPMQPPPSLPASAASCMLSVSASGRSPPVSARRLGGAGPAERRPPRGSSHSGFS